MLNPELAAALAERDRRSKRRAFSPELLCFGPQLAAVISPARRKVLKCGRRAGKTVGIAVKLLTEALRPPNVPCLYVTGTRANAKEIIWEDLLKLNDEYGLGGVPNLTDLTLKMPTGTPIQLRGVNNSKEIAKVRGKRFKFVAVDEAQSIPDSILRPFITSDLGAALTDYDAELWQVGTPPPVKAGYFYECYAGRLASEREQHRWTVRENERFPAVLAGRSIDDILAGVRRENGWSEEDTTYRREYLGEDVEDLDSLLFRLGAEAIIGAPSARDDSWTYVFGVDIGHDDSDAIAVWGWPRHSRRVELVKEYIRAKADVTDLAEQLKELIPVWRPIRMAIDQGGLGKKIAEELRRRHALHLEPAEKSQKPTWIKLFNTAARKGELAIPASSRLAEDAKLVQRCPKAWMRGELKERERGSGGYHSDILDAGLYGWRAALAYLEQDAPAPPPDRGEAIRRAIIERNMRQQAMDEVDSLGAALGFE